MAHAKFVARTRLLLAVCILATCQESLGLVLEVPMHHNFQSRPSTSCSTSRACNGMWSKTSRVAPHRSVLSEWSSVTRPRFTQTSAQTRCSLQIAVAAEEFSERDKELKPTNIALDLLRNLNSPREVTFPVVAGKTKKARKLREQALQASKHSKSVIITGEAALDTCISLGFLIHVRSGKKDAEMVHFSCTENSFDTIFGTENTEGLLDMTLSGGKISTILFTHLEKCAHSDVEGKVIHEAFQNRTYFSRYHSKKVHCPARLMFASEKDPKFLCKQGEDQRGCTKISIPHLKQRSADVQYMIRTLLVGISKKDNTQKATISAEAVQRLQSYTWPGNLPELSGVVMQSSLKARVSGENQIRFHDVFIEAPFDYLRVRLFHVFPGLWNVVTSYWVWDGLNVWVIAPAFLVFNAALLLGPQTRDLNIATTLVWAWWWPGVVLTYPLVSRMWCSVCPFSSVAKVVQNIVKASGGELRRWPREVVDNGPAFAYSLFASIILWEELWNLPNDSTLTSALLLLITAGAVISTSFFEKRMWCAKLCPVGAMSGVFGTIGALEVRSWKGICEGCEQPSCTSGGVKLCNPTTVTYDEWGHHLHGHATIRTVDSAQDGCPINQKPNQLSDNYDCTMCFSCVKACDYNSPELNLRPPGMDYGLPWFGFDPDAGKHGYMKSTVKTNFWIGQLLLLLEGSVFVHLLPRIVSDVNLPQAYAFAQPNEGFPFAMHALLATTVVLAPGVAVWIAHNIPSLMNGAGKDSENVPTEVSSDGLKGSDDDGLVPAMYGYLPMVWGSLAGYWMKFALLEGAEILPRASYLIGDVAYQLPHFAASADVTSAVQGFFLLASLPLSFALTKKMCTTESNAGEGRAMTHMGLQAVLTGLLLHLMVF